MNYLWILAFCLCGALATPITEDETQPEEMATELDIVEERDDELVDKIEDEGEDYLEERAVKIAKERKTLEIKCPKNKKIRVTKALYGTKKCKKASRKSFKIASKLCNGKKKCAIKASNKVFGDPCVGTRKSLKVSYVCAKA